MAIPDSTTASTFPAGADVVIPLHAEELSIARTKINRGTVRVEVKTQSREQIIDELLSHERVEIERVPIGRTVQTAPDVREEGDTTIISVVEEVIVTERRLVLKEEIRLRRVRTTERHTETVTLRTQDAEIARMGPAPRGLTHPQALTEESHR